MDTLVLAPALAPPALVAPILAAPSNGPAPVLQLNKVSNNSAPATGAPTNDGYAIREEDYATFDIKRYVAKPPSPFKKGGAVSFYVEGTYAYDTILKGKKTGGRTVAVAKIEFPHTDGNRVPCKGGLKDKKNYSKEELEMMDKDKSYIAEGTSSGDFKSMYELDHTNPVHKQLMRILMEIYRAHLFYMAQYGAKGLLVPGKKYACKPGLAQMDPFEIEEDHLTCPVWFKEKEIIRMNEDTQVPEQVKVRDLDAPATLKLISGHSTERKVHSKWFTLPKEEVKDEEGNIIDIKIGEPTIIPPEELTKKSLDTIPLVKISSIINPSPSIRLMVDSSYVKDTFAIGSIEQKITIDRERDAMLAAFEASRSIRSKYEDAMTLAIEGPQAVTPGASVNAPLVSDPTPFPVVAQAISSVLSVDSRPTTPPLQMAAPQLVAPLPSLSAVPQPAYQVPSLSPPLMLQPQTSTFIQPAFGQTQFHQHIDEPSPTLQFATPQVGSS